MLNFFKGNSLFVLFLLPLLAAAFYVRLFVNPAPHELPTDLFRMPLYELFNYLIPIQKSGIVAGLLTLTLVIIQVYILAGLSSNFALFEQRTYLPPVIYLIITGFLVPVIKMHPVHFGIIFLLLAIKNLMGITRNQDVRGNFFNVGIYLAIGSLFYIGLLPFYIAFLVSFLFVYPFDKKLWIISLFGLAVPFLFYFTYLFAVDGNIKELGIDIVLASLLADAFPELILPAWIFIGFLISLIIFAGFKQFQLLTSRNIVTRRVYISLFIILVSSVLIVLLIPLISLELLFIIAIPVSLLFADMFISMNSKFMEEIIFLSMVIFSAFIIIIS